VGADSPPGIRLRLEYTGKISGTPATDMRRMSEAILAGQVHGARVGSGKHHYRGVWSMTSSLVMRMQPEDTALPIFQGSLVP